MQWYNHDHERSAIRFVTPESRYTGREAAILAHRRLVSDRARRHHPERRSGASRNWTPVTAVRLTPTREELLNLERIAAQ